MDIINREITFLRDIIESKPTSEEIEELRNNESKYFYF